MQEKCAFHAQWQDGSSSEFPFIWLRHNDQEELHPQTKERTFDLTSVSLDIQPNSFTINDEVLTVDWPGKETPSHYKIDWLYHHRPGIGRADPAQISKRSWHSIDMPELPRFNAKECHKEPSYLFNCIKQLKQTGIVLIDHLEDHLEAGSEFGDLIGFKRQTNFGTTFEVFNKPSPNNLAYTALALPLHTDLPNQELVPGIQFLHCYKNDAQGGASVFADAMAIVEDFEQDHPEYFKLLSELSLPWRFHDDNDDIRHHRPIIGLDSLGRFKTLTFNAHLADVPDFEAQIMYSFYAAFQELMRRVRSSKYRIEYSLQAGEMMVFDNQRALHGRAEFDPNSGERHLRGFYIEHNEFNSRLRMLAKTL